jgi:hypothetical protein
MTLTKNEVQARIAKMIPGGLLLEFMSYDHIVELMTVTQSAQYLSSDNVSVGISAQRSIPHLEKHRLIVALQAHVEAIDRIAGARPARRDQRGAAVGRYQRHHRVGGVRRLAIEIDPRIETAWRSANTGRIEVKNGTHNAEITQT